MKFVHLGIIKNYIKDAELSVIADRDCPALEYAKTHGIQNYKINYNLNKTEELNPTLDKIEPDIIITNWHKIIDKHTVEKNSGKLINLHYSLLPAFSGLIGMEPIERAYRQGCKFIGPTCHLVEEKVDAGKILSQSIFRADIPIKKAVRKMFRSGCVTLLEGMQIILGKQLRALGIESDVLFDNGFWEELEKR